MGTVVRRGEDDYEPAPLGLQDAVCVTYYDIGLQRWDEKVQPKVILYFELAARKSDGRPFTISKEFTQSLGERASLRAFLENWRGRGFSADELEGFDLDNLVGKSCQINLIERPSKKGGSYVEIAAIMRPRVKTVPVTARTYVPDWVQRKIDGQVIPELEAARARQAGAPPHAGTYSPPPAYGSSQRPAQAPQEGFDDSIPF